MITDLILPKFNMDMESGVLIRWLRREGDRVSVGDPVAEVGTDKVNMEVEATADGILFDLRFAEGDTVPVTTPIARIASDETEITALAGRRPAPRQVGTAEGSAPQPAVPEHPELGPAVSRASSPEDRGLRPSSPLPDVATNQQPREASAVGGVGRPRATPAARRLARELGIDLAALPSTGRRITSLQVQEAATRPASPREASWSDHASGQAAISGRPIRHLAFHARNLDTSEQGPVVTLWSDVRPGRDLDGLGSSSRPSRAAAWIFLVARALQDHPLLNCSLREGALVPNRGVHVALHMPGDAGLRSVLVREADRLTLLDIDDAIRQQALHGSEVAAESTERGASTFTVVDLTDAEIDGFAPALRPSQVATLGIGRLGPRATAADGQGLRVETRVQLTLVCDGRAVDEARAAAFLATLRGLVMNPNIVDEGLAAAESLRSATSRRT